MTDSPFRGVIPPVVIPLTEKRQLDLEALERSINRMIEAGVDGLFFLGSSGEVAFLTAPMTEPQVRDRLRGIAVNSLFRVLE